VEAEKSVLAVTAAAQREGRKVLVVGMGGAFGWKGRIAIAENSKSKREPLKGPLPELKVVCPPGSKVLIWLDRNADPGADGSPPNWEVVRARRELTEELLDYGCRVYRVSYNLEPTAKMRFSKRAVSL
jgi:hypothetical protein